MIPGRGGGAMVASCLRWFEAADFEAAQPTANSCQLLPTAANTNSCQQRGSGPGRAGGAHAGAGHREGRGGEAEGEGEGEGDRQTDAVFKRLELGGLMRGRAGRGGSQDDNSDGNDLSLVLKGRHPAANNNNNNNNNNKNNNKNNKNNNNNNSLARAT